MSNAGNNSNEDSLLREPVFIWALVFIVIPLVITAIIGVDHSDCDHDHSASPAGISEVSTATK